MSGRTESTHFENWERARVAIIAFARVIDIQLPEWYWCNWMNLTSEQKDRVERILTLSCDPDVLRPWRELA